MSGQEQLYAEPVPYFVEDDKQQTTQKAPAANNEVQQQHQCGAGSLVVCKASDQGAQLILSDCGTAYLPMRKRGSTTPALSTQRAAAAPATQQMFALPTPYFEA